MITNVSHTESAPDSRAFLSLIITLMNNDSVLSLRIPEELLKSLTDRFPDVTVRNMAIRILLQRLASGKIKVNVFESA